MFSGFVKLETLYSYDLGIAYVQGRKNASCVVLESFSSPSLLTHTRRQRQDRV